MWVSKRKWNEMEDKIKILNKQIYSLLNIHSCKQDYSKSSYNDISWQIHSDAMANGHYIESIKVNTKYIKDVTIHELANLVIDGTPITRKENIDVKVEYRGVK